MSPPRDPAATRGEVVPEGNRPESCELEPNGRMHPFNVDS